MTKLKFPKPYQHDHAPVKNINDLIGEQLTIGQKAADWVVARVGSWGFIIGQSALLGVWAIVNVTAWVQHWDPYPFILMNLILSLQAAYTAPMIMMSQNRQAARDRLEAHNDYEINQKAEIEIRAILETLDAQNCAIAELHLMLEELHNKNIPAVEPQHDSGR
ncbi:MAG: DUF1003 domain-containing protein [Desulfuromonadaceae bacterium]|nr:DUF1003 domain-containing protein [Desulfuromonadaceae bacterium]